MKIFYEYYDNYTNTPINKNVNSIIVIQSLVLKSIIFSDNYIIISTNVNSPYGVSGRILSQYNKISDLLECSNRSLIIFNSMTKNAKVINGNVINSLELSFY